MKLKNLIQNLRNRLPSWSRVLKVLSITIRLALLGALCWAVYHAYISGYEKGRRVGQCEAGCLIMDGQLDSVDDEGICWCVPIENEEVFIAPVPEI